MSEVACLSSDEIALCGTFLADVCPDDLCGKKCRDGWSHQCRRCETLAGLQPASHTEIEPTPCRSDVEVATHRSVWLCVTLGPKERRPKTRILTADPWRSIKKASFVSQPRKSRRRSTALAWAWLSVSKNHFWPLRNTVVTSDMSLRTWNQGSR